jgi:hypothetical protein
MPRSRNKYSRARIRARVRRPKRRGGAGWFYGALALIVVAGIVGIVLVRSSNNAALVPPQPGDPTTGAPGDHWHTALGVNVCGDWLPPAPAFEQIADNPNVRAGIHTHGDGFIHDHPFTTSEGGDHATFGRFLNYGGWSASSESVQLWTGPSGDTAKKSWSNGDKCPPGTPMAGRVGEVKWAIDCGKERTDNSSDYKLHDLQVLALAFLPKGVAIGTPPNASSTPQNDQGVTPNAFNIKKCSTAGPGGATPSSSTPAPSSSTSAPAATTPTSKP